MPDERVPVKVMGVYANDGEGIVSNHFVIFQDEAGRRLPIFIGQFEAWAISLALEGTPPDRPFTHDAMLTCLTVAGATVEEACISEQRHEVDVRPSDAVALALRAKCPLFISETVMQAAQQTE